MLPVIGAVNCRRQGLLEQLLVGDLGDRGGPPRAWPFPCVGTRGVRQAATVVMAVSHRTISPDLDSASAPSREHQYRVHVDQGLQPSDRGGFSLSKLHACQR